MKNNQYEFKKMSELIIETIFNISRNAQSKIDKDLKDPITNFIYIISKVFIILNKVVNHTDQSKVSNKLFDSQMILWQGGNALIGSLQIIRQGYFLEPTILMRNAIENLAMALSFYTNENKYVDFTNKNLSGEKCIGEAKKLVKQIGPIYGLLSEFAHPSKNTLGYYYMSNKDSLGTLLIGGGVKDNTMHRVKFNLAILNFISTIYWSSSELIFHDYLKSYVFWEKNKDMMKWAPKKEEASVFKKSEALFREALEEQKCYE